MKVALTHTTRYQYDRLVELSPQVVRLRPAPHSRTPISAYSLKITPEEHFLNWQQDAFANYLGRIVVPEKTKEFCVTVDLVAELNVINPFDFFLEPDAETFPFTYDAQTKRDLDAYLDIRESGPQLMAFVEKIDRTPRSTIDFIVEVNQKVTAAVDYIIRMETGVQTCEETFTKGRGSCRDSAWLLVQVLRHCGLAARFASGYSIQLKPDQKALDGPSGTDRDIVDLHAWAEVYLPGAGWVGMDATSGLLTGEGHIPLACAPNPTGAAPISGMASSANVDFSFEMEVRRLTDGPRITKPFPDDMWAKIDQLGEEVDKALVDGDVRLTMGGEPTFVAIDNVDHPEWNTEAVGPTKRVYADVLIKRLRDTVAPGAMLHYGQGKWYPGESLPRWAFALYWRSDGEPVWGAPELIATENAPANPSVETAGEFAAKLAENLGLERDYAQACYEDPLPFIGQEMRLPDNLTTQDNKLENPEDRIRLAKVFERGLGKATGYAIPLQKVDQPSQPQQDMDRGGWRSEMWKTRRGKLFLAPGDSPAGLRLPIAALPWVPESAYPYFFPADPFEEPRDLPEAIETKPKADESAPKPKRDKPTQRKQASDASEDGARQDVREQELDADSEAIRTALAVEPRNGHLCVFLPPTENAADYVELVQAVEATARSIGTPIYLEGYTPPATPQLNVLKVTPDPGVIEVNVHPVSSWKSQKAAVELLYEEARLSRLTAEKFMIDGTHTGTGGGNHIVVGAARAVDSPFLRRPDLLRSILTFWQHHPSMSYLFSGMFIGPTSQSPRIDEARNDSLYELEIAFKEIDRLASSGQNVKPWIIDRLLRNILIDSTGNTHRTEISIDKLYSPDGPTGRLGLVEFRGFEMPPHPRMSLVQQLLIRALIARFWNAPYRGAPIRWGTALHDKFMLPQFVWQDFLTVLDDLHAHGFSFDPHWFEAFQNFRFAHYGKVTREGITLSLRQALEPWHVLGEEGAIGGTARYVDSSLERMQARVSAFDPERYSLSCNGYAVPLTATDTQGDYVGGVRFKAWQPARSLHPTLPIDSPLVFDIYDRWHGRSIGGCTYHVSHPGGRSFETLPVNSYEAEGRRLARFSVNGHTPGPMAEPQRLDHPQFPYCLDLRRR